MLMVPPDIDFTFVSFTLRGKYGRAGWSGPEPPALLKLQPNNWGVQRLQQV